MENVIRLEAENGYLSLSCGESGWCQCAYEAGARLILGAEAISYIVPRLAKALGSTLDSSAMGSKTEILGHDAYYVLVLKEHHHSLFVAETGTHRTLIWVDAQPDPPKIAAQLLLNEHQRQQWFNRLETLVETTPPVE